MVVREETAEEVLFVHVHVPSDPVRPRDYVEVHLHRESHPDAEHTEVVAGRSAFPEPVPWVPVRPRQPYIK